MSEKEDIPGVIAPPPLIFGVPLVALLILNHFWNGAEIPVWVLSWPIRAFAGSALVILGAGLIVWAGVCFRIANTPPEPWRETTAFTRAGPYAFTRNPMYLGMALIYFGIAFIAGDLIMLASLVPVLFVVDRFVVAREERYLLRKFEADYRPYLAETRRWL